MKYFKTVKIYKLKGVRINYYDPNEGIFVCSSSCAGVTFKNATEFLINSQSFRARITLSGLHYL